MYVDTIVLSLLCLVAIPAAIRLMRVHIPKETINKYSLRMHLELVIPFIRGWQGKIDSSDLELFRRYRRALFRFYLFGLGVALGYSFYLYLKYIYFFDRSRGQ